MEKAYDTFNDVLVNLFNEIMDIEARAIITPEFKDITNNDMHVIEAVGIGEPRNMSAVANLSSPNAAYKVNNLVKKGYIERVRSKEDRRVVLVSLTEKGKKAYQHHKRFHEEMIQSLLKGLSDQEINTLVTALTNLREFFRNY